MASTTAICSSFKAELMNGIHAFGPGTGVPARTVSVADVFKLALFTTTATLGASTATYTTSNECTATTGYTAGGNTITFAAVPSVDGTTGVLNPSNAGTTTWTVTGTLACESAQLYNSSQGNKSVAIWAGLSSVTNGTLTLTYPAAQTVAAGALLRIA